MSLLFLLQSKAKAEKNQAIQRSMSENSCQLCAVEKLTFEPPPIYCSPCGARIKRNAPYYTIGMGDTRHFFCTHCYNETRGDSIEVEGTFHQKAKLEKKKNDEETEEWVSYFCYNYPSLAWYSLEWVRLFSTEQNTAPSISCGEP